MPEMKELFDELRKTHEALKESVDQRIGEIEKRGIASPDLDEKIEKINAALTEVRAKYDEMVAASKRPSGGMAGAGANGEPSMESRAFLKFVRYGMGETGRAMFEADELRALSSASDKDGGFMVPTDFETQILMQAYNEAAIRAHAVARPTGRDTVTLPALAKPAVAWGTRNIAIDLQDLAAGGERIEIFDQKALILISNNTLDDEAADILAEIQGAFAPALAESEDDAFVSASGVNSPQGVLAHPDVIANAVNTGVADALYDASNNGIDALIDLMASVKSTYRRNGVWLMNSKTEADVRKRKDDNGQYLWQPPVQAGMPATLLGRPVAIPEGMPDVAANSYPIVFGDLRRGYAIRDRVGLSVQRLVEKYAEFDQTGFLIKRRLGGQVVLAEAIRPIKVAV
jgi:HK97 family phage major capsid protein